MGQLFEMLYGVRPYESIYHTAFIDHLKELAHRMGERQKPDDKQLYADYYKIKGFRPELASIIVHFREPGSAEEKDFITVVYDGLSPDKKDLDVFRMPRTSSRSSDSEGVSFQERLVSHKIRVFLAELAWANSKSDPDPVEVARLIEEAHSNTISRLNQMFKRIFGDPEGASFIDKNNRRLLTDLRSDLSRISR